MSHTITTLWNGDRIVTVSFSDPQRHNQICWAAIDEMGELLCECRERGARVVIMASGDNDRWYGHAWLQDLINGIEGSAQTGTGIGWFTALEELTHEYVGSIAVVNGPCAGGGAELGWACDLRIAEEQATFCQPEVDLGLTTGLGGSSRLARLAGRGVATEMVLTGRPVSANRLFQLGAINQLVDRGQALPTALALAEELVKKPHTALAGLKRVLAVSDEAPLSEALGNEQSELQKSVRTEEALQAMKNAAGVQPRVT